jgi:hypothetical protein
MKNLVNIFCFVSFPHQNDDSPTIFAPQYPFHLVAECRAIGFIQISKSFFLSIRTEMEHRGEYANIL